MIALRYVTPRAWADAAACEPLALLSDHAHCELQAATAAQALIVRNPDFPRLVDQLSVLVIEEMRHFRRVLAMLRELGGELAPAETNLYAARLHRAAGPTCGPALLDRLLVAGLIESRSRERFQLLAGAAWPDSVGAAELPRLYAELEPSEAGHGRMFLELALERFSRAAVEARAAELAVLEAEVVRALPPGPRVHSGAGNQVSTAAASA